MTDVTVLDLLLTNHIAELPRCMEQLEAFGQRHGLQEAENLQMQLMVEELVTNAIQYGVASVPAGWVRLGVRLLPDAIHIEITDNGQFFNPLSVAAPDITLDVESRSIGGLGIHFVRQMAGSVHYVRAQQAEQEINRLTIIKKRA